MNLSIIIVNYNTKELLTKCLEDVYRWCEEELKKEEYEIIIVDNGSCDGSIEHLDNLSRDTTCCVPTIIKNHTNLGFAKANNIGIKSAQGKNILLLNSDTAVNSLVIQKTLKFLEEFKGDFKGKIKGEVGVATCKILLANGKIDPSCHRGFPTPWNAFCYFLKLEKLFPRFKLFSGYHQYYKDLSSVHEVDAISGAFFMIRRDVIDAVGLLDEDYFMYGEDLDWCYRIKAAGYRIMYNPSYSIIHHKKKSGRQSQNSALQKQTQRYFWQTMRIFYEKHYLKKYPRIVSCIILRMLDFLCRGGFVTRPMGRVGRPSPTKKYNTILFDWDGCLLETLQVWLDAYKQVFAEYGLFPQDELITNKVFGDWNGPLKVGLQERDLKTYTEKLVKIVDRNLPSARIQPHVVEMLDDLINNDKKIGIITTSRRENVRFALKDSKLERYFTVVIAKEDVEKQKPDPESVDIAINLLQAAKSGTIIVGDSDKDLILAQNAGVDSILYYPSWHKKFYNLDLLKKKKPNYIIQDFDELKQIVL